jgi:hypothetical protein
MVNAKLYMSDGYTTNDDGTRVPKYIFRGLNPVQVQAMSSKELTQLNELNLGGVLRKVYLFGDWNSIVRGDLKGGDLFIFPDDDANDRTWLVVNSNETWPDWCSVTIQLQLPTEFAPATSTAYFGSSLATVLDAPSLLLLSGNVIQAGFKSSYAMPAGGYKYLVFPTSWGIPSAFIDPTTGFEVPFETPYFVAVNGTPCSVYRTSWVLNAALSIEVL